MGGRMDEIADPVTILLAASTAVGAAGSVMGGLQQSDALKASARANEDAARQAQRLGAQNEAAQLVENRRLEGRQIASVGASGLTLSGSPLDFSIDQQVDAQMAALRERYGASEQARGYRNQAAQDRAGAKNAKSNGIWSGAAQLLSGGADAFKAYKDWKRT